MKKLKDIISAGIFVAGLTGMGVNGYETFKNGHNNEKNEDRALIKEYNGLRNKIDDIRKNMKLYDLKNEEDFNEYLDLNVEMEKLNSDSRKLRGSDEMIEYKNNKDDLKNKISFNLIAFVVSSAFATYGFLSLFDNKRKND